MKVVSINGSARGAKGITHRLLNSFTNGLADSGCTVKSYNLNELNIAHCKSCFYCMHNQPGICSIKDDMTSIYEDLEQADALIIGTPLYTDTMSSRMKVIFDRCISSMQPFIHEDDRGRYFYYKAMPDSSAFHCYTRLHGLHFRYGHSAITTCKKNLPGGDSDIHTRQMVTCYSLLID